MTVSVNGRTYSQWKKIAVHASVKDATRTLELTIADVLGAPEAPGIFAPGALLTTNATNDLIFTGYVDKLAPHVDGKSYHVVISARSKGQDAVDSSVDHTKGDYVNKTVLDVLKDQDAFGIGFSTDSQLTPFDRWRPNVGQTLWHSAVSLCEDDGVTMAGQADGSIKLTMAGATAKAQGAAIVEGVNLFTGDASFDWQNRHSTVKAHGQSYKGTGAQNTQIMATANDSTVQRYRPIHVHHHRHTNRNRLKNRAKRRRDKEAGEGTRATIRMKGWRDDSGMLWTPGNKVFVKSPSLFLAQYMLLENVVYDQEGEGTEGTVAHLELVDPRAHGGTGGGVNKSGAPWGFDDSAPQ